MIAVEIGTRSLNTELLNAYDLIDSDIGVGSVHVTSSKISRSSISFMIVTGSSESHSLSSTNYLKFCPSRAYLLNINSTKFYI